VKVKLFRPLFLALMVFAAVAAQAQAYKWGSVAIGGGGFVSAIVPSQTERGLFYARTDVGGAYRWDAARAAWVPLLDGLSEDDVGLMSVESLALDPNDSAVVYPFDTSAVWVTSGNGVFRTADIDAANATWTFAVKGLEETVPTVVASVPGGPLLSTILDYDGFRHGSLDAYAPIHTPRMGSTTGLAVAPAAPSVAVRVGDKMYRSADMSVRWMQVPGIKGAKGTVVLSADGASLLHTVPNKDGTHTTYRSTNFTGDSPDWTAVAGLGTGAVRPAADPVNAGKFYVYDHGTVRVSTDGGASFTAAATLASGGSTLLRAAPGREGDVWVALKEGGLARSTNSGSSFGVLPNVSFCGAVGFGRAMRGATYPTVFIWGSVKGGRRGLYRSTDAGARWVRINDDAHQYGGPGNGEFVVGDMNTEGVVYMSSVGRGIVYGVPVGSRRSSAKAPRGHAKDGR